LHNEPVFFLLGANHVTAPMAVRELLYINEDSLAAFLPQVRRRFGLLELVALSTCNRFELMGVAPASPDLTAQLHDAFFALHRHHGTLHQTYSDDDLRQSLYLHFGTDAVRHLYRVAASLDSLVLGETQITGQFKDALALATRLETLGPTVRRIGQEALATAKKVRNQTAIGKKHVSIGHAALDLAKKVFGDLSAHKFLVVGAGEMATVTAKYVMDYKPRGLYIANRSAANARKLTEQLGAGEIFGMEELPALLLAADVVISATSAPGIVLDLATLQRAHAARRGRPLILLDIAMPRDIDPAAGQLEDVYLFDIDDLQQVTAANLEERRKAAEEAEVFINRGVEQFEAWQRTSDIKPMLAAFRTYLEQLTQREGAKTLSKEIFKDLSAKQMEALQGLLSAVASKISADAARHVLAPPPGFAQDQLATSLQALFLDEQILQKKDTA